MVCVCVWKCIIHVHDINTYWLVVSRFLLVIRLSKNSMSVQVQVGMDRMEVPTRQDIQTENQYLRIMYNHKLKPQISFLGPIVFAGEIDQFVEQQKGLTPNNTLWSKQQPFLNTVPWPSPRCLPTCGGRCCMILGGSPRCRTLDIKQYETARNWWLSPGVQAVSCPSNSSISAVDQVMLFVNGCKCGFPLSQLEMFVTYLYLFTDQFIVSNFRNYPKKTQLPPAFEKGQTTFQGVSYQRAYHGFCSVIPYTIPLYHVYIYIYGWWFGTCFFSIYWEESSPLTNTFQRSRSTTNQRYLASCTLTVQMFSGVSQLCTCWESAMPENYLSSSDMAFSQTGETSVV